jgi:hypothetical protein
LIEKNIQIEVIEKSFRKVQPFTPLYSGFEEESPAKPEEKELQPYNSKETLTFKYPNKRPTWEAIKDDQYYYLIQTKKNEASLKPVQGIKWIGLEEDKETYLDNIVKLYLENIDEEKIWIVPDNEDKSLLSNYSALN